MPFRKENMAHLLGIVLLSASSYTFAEDTAIENHEQSIGEQLFTINNDTDVCELVVKTDNGKTHLPLSLSTPCYWITKSDSTDVQLHSYPTQNIDHVFLIAGTALDWDDEKKQYHKLPTDTYCSQYLQGTTIVDGSVTIVDKKMDAPNCIGQNIDEKVFNGVALQRNVEPEEEEGLFNSLKKTFQQLFNSKEDTPQNN